MGASAGEDAASSAAHSKAFSDGARRRQNPRRVEAKPVEPRPVKRTALLPLACERAEEQRAAAHLAMARGDQRKSGCGGDIDRRFARNLMEARREQSGIEMRAAQRLRRAAFAVRAR